jgi:hypothetical protein
MKKHDCGCFPENAPHRTGCPEREKEVHEQKIEDLKREIQAEDEAKQNAIEQRDIAYAKLDAATLQIREMTEALKNLRVDLRLPLEEALRAWRDGRGHCSRCGLDTGKPLAHECA